MTLGFKNLIKEVIIVLTLWCGTIWKWNDAKLELHFAGWVSFLLGFAVLGIQSMYYTSLKLATFGLCLWMRRSPHVCIFLFLSEHTRE